MTQLPSSAGAADAGAVTVTWAFATPAPTTSMAINPMLLTGFPRIHDPPGHAAPQSTRGQHSPEGWASTWITRSIERPRPRPIGLGCPPRLALPPGRCRRRPVRPRRLDHHHLADVLRRYQSQQPALPVRD